MRPLVLIAGIFLSLTGAFCFVFYTSTFYEVAFLVGVVMMLSGAFNTIAYLISGKGSRKLTETTLVEGVVTLLYGFAVLNNQVTESMLTMFFGTWLTLCGVTRFSQSLYVSRFNSKDWSKIVPLSAISSMLGVIMMLPWIVYSVMPLMLVGGAFLVDGLSMIIYSMYMLDSTKEMAVGEERAKIRAREKKAEHKAKIKERERLRNMSAKEREAEEKRRRLEDKKIEEARAKKRAETREALKKAVKPAEEKTLRLSDNQVKKINDIIDNDKRDVSSIKEKQKETPVVKEVTPSVKKEAALVKNNTVDGVDTDLLEDLQKENSEFESITMQALDASKKEDGEVFLDFVPIDFDDDNSKGVHVDFDWSSIDK